MYLGKLAFGSHNVGSLALVRDDMVIVRPENADVEYFWMAQIMKIKYNETQTQLLGYKIRFYLPQHNNKTSSKKKTSTTTTTSSTSTNSNNNNTANKKKFSTDDKLETLLNTHWIKQTSGKDATLEINDSHIMMFGFSLVNDKLRSATKKLIVEAINLDKQDVQQSSENDDDNE